MRYYLLTPDSMANECAVPVFCDPPYHKRTSLNPPLTKGELKVLTFFYNSLPNSWEIYVQPYLNGLRPDFVLLQRGVGAAVFEVKDWSISAQNLHLDRSGKKPELVAQDRKGKSYKPASPVAQVQQYKKLIMEIYAHPIGQAAATDPKNNALVTAGVIFPFEPRDRVHALLAPLFSAAKKSDKDRAKAALYNPVSGKDDLDRGKLENVFPEAKRKRSHLMTDEMWRALRTWLIEPDHARERGTPLVLSPRQKEFAESRTASGYRRIRGPAGSGKSVVIAKRAAHLVRQGKRVLVCCYNITMINRLVELTQRALADIQGAEKIKLKDHATFLHFHGWGRQICVQAGMHEAWGEAMRHHDFVEGAAHIIHRAISRIESDPKAHLTTYDALLVDEGQDMMLVWWNALRRVISPERYGAGGEYLLVADTAQDIYGCTNDWTRSEMKGWGFRGEWPQLEASYRYPKRFVPHLQRFYDRLIAPDLCQREGEDDQDRRIRRPEAPRQREIMDTQVRCVWKNIEGGSQHTIPCIAIAIKDMINSNTKLQPSDITILLWSHQLGMEVTKGLEELLPRAYKANNEDEYRASICHVFGHDSASQRLGKLQLWSGDGRIKASTFQSFKGWESAGLILHIPGNLGPLDFRQRAQIYVGMSRLRYSAKEGGVSCITVLNASQDPGLRAYGATWDEA